MAESYTVPFYANFRQQVSLIPFSIKGMCLRYSDVGFQAGTSNGWVYASKSLGGTFDFMIVYGFDSISWGVNGTALIDPNQHVVNPITGTPLFSPRGTNTMFANGLMFVTLADDGQWVRFANTWNTSANQFRANFTYILLGFGTVE